MNKKLLGIVIIIIVLIIGGLAFLMMDSDEDSESSSQASPSDTSDVSEPTGSAAEEAPAASAGKYTDYDESLLASTEGTKIIFFYAPWCPQCRALEADILDKGVPAGVTIFKLDYDTNQDLRQKYGVTIQTTLVKVDENGDEIEKFVAYDEPTLESVKENLL